MHQSRKVFCMLLLIMTSCVEVIEMDLKTDAPVIMIDGKITDTAGKSDVKITTSIDVNDRNEFPPVTDAIVNITDLSTGEEETLTQDFPGVYKVNVIQGVSGHTYAMEVIVDNARYTATSTMPEKVIFEGLTYETTIIPNTGERIRMVAKLKDPDRPGNNYRYIMYQNGIQSQNIFVRNDAFTNGNEIRQAIYNSSIKIVKGDMMRIEMQCIDEAVYNYFNGLMLLQSDRGIAPTNPATNIHGGALGYFSAFTSEQREVRID